MDTVLNALLSKAAELLDKHGQDAIDLSLDVLFLTALSNIILGVILLILLIVVFFYSKNNYKRWLSVISLSETDDFIRFIYVLVVGVAFILISVALVHSIRNLFDIWNWIGLFYPEAYGLHILTGR